METSFTCYQEIIPRPLILYLSLLRTVSYIWFEPFEGTARIPEIRDQSLTKVTFGVNTDEKLELHQF